MMKGRFAGLMLAVIVAGTLNGPAQSAPAPAPLRPVMVAGNDDLDACLSTSFVKPLKPGSFLSVRAGPSVRSREIDRLRPGDAVWNCDSAGDWAGVVYRAGQTSQAEGIECDLGPSDTPRRPYRGECRSGWVHGSYLLSLAG
jgi:hypothetical protein